MIIYFPKEWNVTPIGLNSKIPPKGFNSEKYNKEKFPRKDLFLYEPCNYSVRCGKTSNNLVILDFDFKDKPFFRNILINLRKLFPEEYKTYIGLTPHGLHIYYYIKGECPKRQTQIKCSLEEVEHVDILGEGGYALISPSMIEDRGYEPLFDVEVRTITRGKFDEICGHYTIQKEEEKIIVKTKPRKKGVIIKKFRTPFQWVLTGDVDVLELSEETGIELYKYWTALYTEALFSGYEPTDIFPLLRINQKSFDYKVANTQIKNHGKKGDLDKKRTLGRLKKLFPSYSGEERDIWLDISDELVDEFDVAIMSDSEKLMIKKGNIYTYKTNEFYKTLDHKVIERTLGKRYDYYVKQILSHLKRSNRFDRDNFCYDEHIIPFLNGYYDTKLKKFVKAEDTKKIFCYVIPHNYERTRGCPKFKELLGEWLKGNGKITEEDIFEMVGYTMTMDVSQRKAFFILGPTTTGKTSFQNILEAVIGKDNRIGTAMQEFGSSRFSMDNMENKILNMVGDMSGSIITDTSYFKLLTGGDTHIQAEVKGGNKYNFKNITKIWYNANTLPILKNKKDTAFHIRWIITEFKNKFKTEEVGAITKIDRRITDDNNEIQGIIHEAIKGVVRLNKRGFFRPEILEGTEHIWNYKSDPMYAFLHDKTIRSEDLAIMALEFHSIFNKWSFKKYGKRYSPYKIKEMLESNGVFKERGNFVNEDGIRPQIYDGVGWKIDNIRSKGLGEF